MRSIRVQFLLVFAVATVVPLALASAFFTWHVREQTRDDIIGRLTTLAAVKQDMLDQHLQTIEQEIKALATNGHVINATSAYAGEEVVDAAAFAGTSDCRSALDAIKRLQDECWGRFHHIFIADTDGHVIISPPHGDATGSHLGQTVEHPDFAGAASGVGCTTDFFGFSEKTHFHQLRLEPVRDESGEVVGVVVAEIVIAHQLEILASQLDLGETGRAFMTTLDGQPIVNDREELLPAHMNDGMRTAIEDGRCVGEFVDPGGTTIVGLYEHDKEYPWILCVEMNRAEAYAPLRRATAIIGATLGTGVFILVVCGVGVSFLLAARLLTPIRLLTERATEIAGGDLSHDDLAVSTRNELGALTASVNKMSNSLRSLVSQVGATSQEVSCQSDQIAEASEQLARGMQLQRDQTTAVAGSIEEMSVSVSDVARQVAEANTLSADAGRRAGDGGEVVRGTIDSIRSIAAVVSESAEATDQLSGRAEQIGQVINVINDIADQTNLLALNAAIEAARAGEHGRGFAVVADEVRKLAERTTNATQEVTESIQAIQQETSGAVERMQTGTTRVAEGIECAERAGAALEKIEQGSDSVAGVVREIAAATEQQAAASDHIASSVESIKSVTDQSAQAASQIAQSTEELNARSDELERLLVRFKLNT
jgi:methyl-accepting chemotaxis protein